jgi:DNA-binding NarL/FixJ family response regulator
MNKINVLSLEPTMMINSPKTIRILVADDHPIVRQGLVAILNDQPDMTVVAEVNNGQQAIAQYRIHQPDVAILDLNMPEVSGDKAISTIRAEFPNAAIIMFSIYETDEDIYQGLRAGAKSYLLKDTPCEGRERWAAIRSSRNWYEVSSPHGAPEFKRSRI